MSVVNAKHLSDVIGLGQSELVAHVVFSPKLNKQIIVTNEVYEKLEQETMEIDRLEKSQERLQFVKASRLTDIVGRIDELEVLFYIVYSSTLGRNIIVSQNLWIALEQQHHIVNDFIANEEDESFIL
ncbi:hypothetical protein [Streptococcus uberis]|uniref:hypothetical protein n=1 Tax=Streptococcus uberis TaxID=1349 RepID=UPI0037A51F87